MSSLYRLVLYSTDPFGGARLPIAALVHTGSVVRIARAAAIPGLKALGSMGVRAGIELTLSALAGATEFALPPTTGPQVTLGDEVPIPTSATDPVRWVEEHVLGESASSEWENTLEETRRLVDYAVHHLAAGKAA